MSWWEFRGFWGILGDFAKVSASVLDQLAFAYHFYGHTGEAYRQNLADNGITLSVKIKELEFDRQGKLSEAVC